MSDGGKNVETELAALRQTADRLTNGLRQMLDVQARQTEMLQAILDAATTPIEHEEEDLTQTLAQMLSTLTEQTKLLVQISSALADPVANIDP